MRLHTARTPRHCGPEMARAQEALSVGCRVTVDPVFHAGELAFLAKHPYNRNYGGPLKPGDIGVITEVATIGGTSAPFRYPFRVQYNASSWW